MTRQVEPQWLAQAIQAAQDALHDWRSHAVAEMHVRAAVPVIEAGLREQIATELEAASDLVIKDASTLRSSAVQWIAVGIRQAASIVRGDQ